MSPFMVDRRSPENKLQTDTINICYIDYAVFGSMGISHGLTNSPPDCWLPSLRSAGLSIPVQIAKKRD